MRLGVHYRLCEDLDGTASLAAFRWPGLVVYVGAVTAVATRIRLPPDGPVVLAATGQALLLQCLYGACGASSEAFLASDCEEENTTERSAAASFLATGDSEWPWESLGRCYGSRGAVNSG